jgi:hypothetical protein
MKKKTLTAVTVRPIGCLIAWMSMEDADKKNGLMGR